MRPIQYLSAIALMLAALPASAATTLITSDAAYTGPELDLSAFANGDYNFTFGPIIIDIYTFVAEPGGSGGYPYGGNSGLGSVVGQGPYGLNGNGSFGDDAVYIGLDSGSGYAQLTLNGGPVSELGFYMNYAPGHGMPPTIWALDAGGNPFAEYDLSALAPIATPGGFNQFRFRGIASDSANIYGLRFGGSYILVTGTENGVPPGAVPEPASWAMLIAGFGLAGGLLRRRTVTGRMRFAL